MKYKVNYGSGLDIEWSAWELLKIQEIKDRKNAIPFREETYSALRCSWPNCHRQQTKDSDLCWKHGKLIRALGPAIRDY